MSKHTDGKSALDLADGSPDITAQCAALDALVMIELPMRAAMTSAMVTQSQYASQIALCKMQQAASLENVEIERRLTEAYARQANTGDMARPDAGEQSP